MLNSLPAMMRHFCYTLYALAALLFTASCSDSSSEENNWFESPSATVDGTTVTFACATHFAESVLNNTKAGFACLPLTSDDSSELLVTTTVTVEGSTLRGTMSGLLPQTVYLYYAFVESNGSRIQSAMATFTTGAGAMPDPDPDPDPDPNPNPDPSVLADHTRWAELPAIDASSDDLHYAAHFCAGLPGGRNYSVCYDAGHRSGLWVAFPIHACYKGDQSRTDAWAYDPEIAQSVQPNLVDGSYQPQIGYSRGHLLASGDRTSSYAANAQTFYVTNMAPQWQNSFNDGVWSMLETDCWNDKNVCADTLYVVSGVWFGNESTTVQDRSGRTCVVPTNFYRVLLRSKAGNTGRPVWELSADELQCVGFWFDNRAYSNGKPSQQMTSVAEIEAKTGLTFFANVPQAPKAEYSASAWSFR